MNEEEYEVARYAYLSTMRRLFPDETIEFSADYTDNEPSTLLMREPPGRRYRWYWAKPSQNISGVWVTDGYTLDYIEFIVKNLVDVIKKETQA